MKKFFRMIPLFAFFLFSSEVYGTQYSRAIAINPHIRIMNYSPNEVHSYTGFYNYVASILFEEGEKVITIAIGDPTAWQITPNSHRLFIKPLQDNAETNALIITNRRVYHFALNAKEALGLSDKNLVFETRFVYPQVNFAYSSNDSGSSEIPDINEDHTLNYNYILSGNDLIKPIRVFDDGRFTYLEFSNDNVNLPAVFEVDEKGYESMINIRTVGRHMIIEKIGSLFTLRYDKDHACLFNKSRPFKLKKEKKKGR
jgi:type IV secretion system protein VirB9